MTDAAARPAVPPARRRKPSWPRRVGLAMLILICIIAVAAAAVWLNRRAAARQVLTGWLEQRGIDADVEVQRIELNGFVGKVRIGDPRDPDFAVERVEVDYAIGLPWSRQGLGVTPSRIRLIRPLLKATWKDGKLSLGSLDPLVEEFTGRPPRPDVRGPLVIVETGRLRLGTEYGPLQVLADARIDDGKLMRLQARMPAASLKSGDIAARGLGGRIDLTTTGDRVTVTVNAAAERFAAAGASAESATLTGTANLPYPDLKQRRGDGRAVLDLTVAGDHLTGAGVDGRDAAAHITFDGATSGWIEAFRITGATTADVRAARIDGAGFGARSATLKVRQGKLDLGRAEAGFDWRLDSPVSVAAGAVSAGDLRLSDVSANSSRLVVGGRGDAVEASGPADWTARQIRFGELSLSQTRGTADLDVTQQGAVLVSATGAMHAARGSWPLFGPGAADDVPELAAMKRALGDFALEVPAFRLTTGSPGTRFDLTRPARIVPANGGVLTLSPVATPLYAAEPGERGGGALTLSATRGQGLPELAVAVPRWTLTAGGFDARLSGRAALDFGIGRGLKLTTAGLLTSDTGRLTYAADDCVAFTGERLELDENDVFDLSGALCPSDGPMVVVEKGSWRADGTLKDIAASAPFLAMRFDQAQGTLAVTGQPSGIGLEARIASARIQDTTEPRRFNPLSASGIATLKDENWTGAFDIASGAYPLGQVTLHNNGLTESGGVAFDFPAVTFAEGGLQPAALSPLVADFVQPPVTGSVAFNGRFDWTPDAQTSSGRLVVPGLDFVSPAGPIKGLQGTIDFTSLAPLATAPNQTLTADSLETITPLTDIAVSFGLDQNAVTIASGDIAVGGGVVRVEPFAVPLDRSQPFGGVIVLERVQLGDLLAGAGFGDKVQLDAVVSGRLPFTSDPKAGIKITGGSLAAVQPGRLSIQREALTDIQAGQAAAGGTAVPPNTVEDLAYQAMENLAFSLLTADVNSLDEGRIGVLFHIKGRHDPPQKQELRLTLSELISREFLKRELPLPSDTGIDLTLDTTLNANQLIGDLMALQRARQGQPEAAPVVVLPPEPVAEP